MITVWKQLHVLLYKVFQINQAVIPSNDTVCPFLHSIHNVSLSTVVLNSIIVEIDQENYDIQIFCTFNPLRPILMIFMHMLFMKSHYSGFAHACI